MTFKVGDVIEHVPSCVGTACCTSKTLYLLACVVETDKSGERIRWRAIVPQDIGEWRHTWRPCSGWRKVGEVAREGRLNVGDWTERGEQKAND